MGCPTPLTVRNLSRPWWTFTVHWYSVVWAAKVCYIYINIDIYIYIYTYFVLQSWHLAVLPGIYSLWESTYFITVWVGKNFVYSQVLFRCRCSFWICVVVSVVSNTFYSQTYLGKWSNLTFSDGLKPPTSYFQYWIVVGSRNKIAAILQL